MDTTLATVGAEAAVGLDLAWEVVYSLVIH